MTHYSRHWNCERCGERQETMDWPKIEVCDACVGADAVIRDVGWRDFNILRQIAHQAYERGYTHGKNHRPKDA